jgi:hypothetical protein
MTVDAQSSIFQNGAPENIAVMPDDSDISTPIQFRTAFEIEQERLKNKQLRQAENLISSHVCLEDEEIALRAWLDLPEGTNVQGHSQIPRMRAALNAVSLNEYRKDHKS